MWRHGLEAGLEAALMETLHIRHQPGPWIGIKGARIATTALSAAAIQAGVRGRYYNDGYGGYEYRPKKKSIRSVVGGLLLGRALGGPKRKMGRY